MSDNDLIRRGDALEICTDYGFSRADECRDAIAALPAVTVGVKSLVWKPDAMKGSYPDRLRAVMPCGSGDYSVAGSKKQDEWQWFRNGYFVDGHQLHDPIPLEAAKAAAQSDYTARILDALTPTSVDASQPADPAVNAPKTVVLQSQPVRYCPICDIADCATHREPVAVTTPDPAAIREAAIREALDALGGADLFGRTTAEKHVALEQYCRGRYAILALIEQQTPAPQGRGISGGLHVPRDLPQEEE